MALFFLRGQLLEMVVAYYVKSHNLGEISFKVKKFTTHNLFLRDLQYNGALKLNIGAIDLTYDRDVLVKKKLNSINIDWVKFELKPTPVENKATAPSAIDLSSFSNILPMIPTSNLDIKNILLVIKCKSKDIIAPLNTKLEGDNLTLSLNLQEQSEIQLADDLFLQSPSLQLEILIKLAAKEWKFYLSKFEFKTPKISYKLDKYTFALLNVNEQFSQVDPLALIRPQGSQLFLNYKKTFRAMDLLINEKFKTGIKIAGLSINIPWALVNQISQADKLFKAKIDLSLNDFGIKGTNAFSANFKTPATMMNNHFQFEIKKVSPLYAELLAFFPQLKKTTEDVQGEIRANGQWSYENNHQRLKSTLELSKMQSEILKYKIQGLNALLDISLPPSGQFLAQGNVNIDEVDVGVKFNKLASLVSYQDSALALKDFSTQFSQGFLRVVQFRYDFLKSAMANFIVQAEKLDLQELLNLGLKDQVIATGSVSGAIPVFYENSKIFIREGQLKSDSDGLIQYSPKASLGGMAQGLNILVNYLKDLHYTDLTLQTTSDERYDMKLFIKIFGKNMALYGERPLQFKMTLNTNLIKMFTAEKELLSFASKLEEGITNNMTSPSSSKDKK